ncbi:MAG: hypothetical protein HY851_11575 [candidate division Zixibacteria bacterium]|nr:hypothetical protein [candidate division Zixibacteria bacterium]
MSYFRLTKWYLDCVSDSGHALIGYAALVRWRGVRLALSGLLTHDGNTAPSRAHLSFCWRPPVESADMINWNSRSLALSGRWCTCAPPIHRVLHQAGGNEIIWHCHQPSSLVSVNLGDGRTIAGRGYVERLNMTGWPQEIGLRHLQWGRFVSEDQSVIWICWNNDLAQTRLMYNGHDVVGSVGDGRVASDGQFELCMSDSRLLRKGAIGTTALGSVPLIRAVLPGHVTSINEEKWLSKGTLTRADGSSVVGWTIHERVTFDV